MPSAEECRKVVLASEPVGQVVSSWKDPTCVRWKGSCADLSGRLFQVEIREHVLLQRGRTGKKSREELRHECVLKP